MIIHHSNGILLTHLKPYENTHKNVTHISFFFFAKTFNHFKVEQTNKKVARFTR